jgi:REP element-mobilizing transposase RayT
MARIARVIAPGIPHHVTQRGNRRQQTFFCDDDYRAYLALAFWRDAACYFSIPESVLESYQDKHL